MSRFVPYLAEEFIERDAVALLAEYEHARGVTVVPPIPIEDVVEKYLKLSVEFDDMHKKLGVPPPVDAGKGPDILGAIFFDEARIVIDEYLDSEENPAREGRYRFTLAHEGGGHWQLHRHLFAKDTAQSSLFGGTTAPSVVCRSSQAKERVEWQADFYASCLLMPRSLVYREWRRFFGTKKAFCFSDYKQDPRWHPPKSTWVPLSTAVNEALSVMAGLENEPNHEFAFNRIARALAKTFGVSTQAMRIRLEYLRLLLVEPPAQRAFEEHF